MTVTVSPPTSSRSPQPAPAPRLPGVTLPSVATGVAVLLASLSLSPVYDSGAWFGATLLTVVAVVSAGAVATWLRSPVFLVPVIQAVVMFAALVSRFGGPVVRSAIAAPLDIKRWWWAARAAS